MKTIENVNKKNQEIEIIWSDVDSSSIDFIHYKSVDRVGYLGITFKNGLSYIYQNVHIDDIADVLKAGSVGKTWIDISRRKAFPYKNVGLLNGRSPLELIGGSNE